MLQVSLLEIMVSFEVVFRAIPCIFLCDISHNRSPEGGSTSLSDSYRDVQQFLGVLARTFWD